MSTVSSTIDCGMFTLEEVRATRTFSYPAHAHDHAYLTLLLDGALFESSVEGRQMLRPDELQFRPRRFFHEAQVVRAPFHAFIAELKPAAVPLVSPLLCSSATFRLPAVALGDLPQRLSEEFPLRDPATPFVLEGLLMQAIGAAARALPQRARARPLRWYDRATAYIETNLTRRLHVDEVADAAGVSLSTLHAGFTRHTGVAVHAYICRRRLTRAAAELLASQTSISDIALGHGFTDQAHFSRRFKEVFGTTPREYRRAYGSRP
jgi:AraC-like DNA-binding protein